MNIAIGSSAQIALFVAPVLVLLSFVVGPHPMALVFNGFELGAVLLAILIANLVIARGRVQLVRGPAAAGRLRGARASSSSTHDQRPAAVADPERRRHRAALAGPALLRARARAELPRGRRSGAIGWLVLSLLVAVGFWLAGDRRSGQLHDRLPHRALAVARQPLRLHPALRATSACPRSYRARAAVLRHRGGARAARLRDPRRRRAHRARSTSSSTCSGRRCCSWRGGSSAASRRTSTPTRTSSSAACGGSSR